MVHLAPWIGALLGATLGSVAAALTFALLWRLIQREPTVAPFPEGLAMYRGIVLGAGTGWAIALRGQPERAASVCLWFGGFGVGMTMLTLTIVLLVHLSRGGPPVTNRAEAARMLWLFSDAGTVPWALGLLWKGGGT